jgi:hypothetical protein
MPGMSVEFVAGLLARATRRCDMLKLFRKKKSLPKGFKAAPPIKNKKLRNLIMGRDITGNGGTNTVSDGHRLLGRQPAHR